MRIAAFILLCGCATAQPPPAPPTPPLTMVDPGECSGDGGRSCYRKGRQLLESRQPEVAQESMESVDRACAAGMEEACDLAELAFKVPRRTGGRNPRVPASVRDRHVRGTVVVRCMLERDGRPRECVVLQALHDEMDAEVLDSISTRTYEPATWGGHPVRVPIDIRIDVSP